MWPRRHRALVPGRLLDQVIGVSGLSIDRSTVTILDLLQINGALWYSQLAEALAFDRSTVSRQVGAAISAGYVSQRVDPNDARARVLALTEDGRGALERVSRGWKTVVETLVGQ